MITLELVQKIWDIITPPEENAVLYEANEIDSIRTPEGSPSLTIDASQRRHLLIPISKDLVAAADKQSAGVHILINEWGERREKRRVIDLVCLKPHLNDLFDLIVFEILHIIDTKSVPPEKASREVLQKWRELLSREPSDLPDRATLIGIFGELLILRNLAALNPASLDNWLGPNGSRYDFYCGSTALEIKTTLQKRGRFITVHGIGQLDHPIDVNLYIAVLKLEETPQTGDTISKIVQDIVSFGADQIKLLMKLANLGITPDLIIKCDEFRYKLVDEVFYEVDKDFPKITLASFAPSSLPSQVIALNYQLDLSSPPPYPIANTQIQDIYRQLAVGSVVV